MYTRCQHCEAIFRVNMREVTVANGQLRCSECQKVFSATNNLSTTMPEKFQPIEVIDPPKKNLSIDEINTLSSIDNWQSHSRDATQPQRVSTYTPPPSTSLMPQVKVSKKRVADANVIGKTKWPLIALLSLAMLLAAQVLYNNRALFTGEPQHMPEQIQMLNHNVFSHPNEPGVLLISASMQNNAEVDQHYPVLEVKLTNSQSQTVALRRFKPSEYLDNYSDKMLLVAKQPTSLKLKIKDPGNNATRFQFNFY